MKLVYVSALNTGMVDIFGRQTIFVSNLPYSTNKSWCVSGHSIMSLEQVKLCISNLSNIHGHLPVCKPFQMRFFDSVYEQLIRHLNLHFMLCLRGSNLGSCPFFTPWRSFAEYWKHFVARFNDVHASGYNSAGSERIWMKFGALWVYCLEPWQIFGAICTEARAVEWAEILFFFCQVNNVNNARLCWFPVSQILRNLSHKTWIREVVNPFGKQILKICP